MNLFGTYLMEEFNLWHLPLNILFNKVNVSHSVSDIAFEKLMYSDMFSKDFETCIISEVTFELKDNVVLIYTPNNNVLLTALNQAEKELQNLKNMEVIVKVTY